MGAPPARLHEVAVRLNRMGNAVTVIAAFPNRPIGRIYDGYRGKFRMCVEEDGIRVLRTWIKPSAASASFFSRAINDLSFTWSSGWTTHKILGKQDVLIVQNPPLFSALSASHLARKTGAKIAMWCGDIWPDVLIESGQLRDGKMASLMRKLQQYGLRKSDLLAVTNPKIAEEIKQRYECPEITVWSNGVDTRQFNPDFRSDTIRSNLGAGESTLLVGYIGLHGRFQGLSAVVEAAASLQDQDIRFVFIGEGVEKPHLKAQAKGLGLKNLKFLEHMPKFEIPRILASCDVSLIALLARMPGTMPSKFYEAIASGSIPLTADGCEAAPLVRKHQVGLVYEPGDTQSVVNSLKKLMAMKAIEKERMRSNARYLSFRFDRDKLARFINLSLMALVENEPQPSYSW